jgi:tetratricopeptide (TPR) repeat protein
LPAPEAESALDELERFAFLAYDPGGQRYRLHALVRQAAGLLDSLEREQARRRHAIHFRDVLAAAEERLPSDGARPDPALRWFDLEQANIRAGQAWAAARVAEDQTAARLASDYAAVATQLLARRLPPDERLAWLDAAVWAAERLSDHAAEAAHLRQLGSLTRRSGDPHRAVALYERGLRLARESGDRQGEAEALGKLGLAYSDLGQHSRARAFNASYLEIARELDDWREVARASWNLALSCEELGDLPDAVAAMDECVALERSHGHPDVEADAAQLARLRARLAGRT